MKPTDAPDPFRSALLGKIALWQAVLDKYDVAVKGDGPLSESGQSTGTLPSMSLGQPTALPVGVFRDKGIKEAIPIYLAAGHRKQSNKEIARGLQKGGIASTAVNFESAVATALSRLKDDGVVLRFSDGWDLAASYPDSLRNRLTKEPKRSAPKAKEKSEPSKKARAKEHDKTAEILKAVGISHGLTAKELIAALAKQGIDTTPDYVRVVTKRLRHRGMIELKEGKFHSTMAAM